MHEGDFYPEDKFNKEFREVLLQSGVHSSRQVVDLVTNLIENSDYIPRDSNLFPVVGYIRARLMANDIPVKWMTGVDLTQEIKVEGGEIGLDLELEKQYQKLCRANQINFYNNVFELCLVKPMVIDAKVKVIFFRTIKQELRRFANEGHKLTVEDVIGMDITAEKDKDGVGFTTKTHWRTKDNGAAPTYTDDKVLDGTDCTGW